MFCWLVHIENTYPQTTRIWPPFQIQNEKMQPQNPPEFISEYLISPKSMSPDLLRRRASCATLFPPLLQNPVWQPDCARKCSYDAVLYENFHHTKIPAIRYGLHICMCNAVEVGLQYAAISHKFVSHNYWILFEACTIPIETAAFNQGNVV